MLEIGPKGFLDKLMTFDDYIADEKVKAQKETIY